MDWSMIASVAGGLLGGNLIAQIQAGRRKEKDRLKLRGETRHGDLSKLYAQIILDTDELISIGNDFIPVLRRSLDFQRRSASMLDVVAEVHQAMEQLRPGLPATKLLAEAHERFAGAYSTSSTPDTEAIRASTASLYEVTHRIELSTREFQALTREANASTDQANTMKSRWIVAAERLHANGIGAHLMEHDNERRAALSRLIELMMPNALATPSITPKPSLLEDPERDVRIEELIVGMRERVKQRNALMELLGGIDRL